MDYTELLYDLIRTYSPSGQENTIANKIRMRLTSELCADQAYLDEVGNVIGIYEGKEPTILLCGHIDTVIGELPTKRDKEFIYGRGAADAKAALASFLCAAYELRKMSFENKIIVAGVVGEEDTGNGIKGLIAGGIKPSYAVFGEPCSLTNIVIGYRGGIRLGLKFRTESFHASSPWLGKSAVDAATELWTFIKKYNEIGADKERKFDTISACLTKISGGESPNISPSLCEMTVDIRFPPSIKSQTIVEEIESQTKKICNQKIEYRIKIEDFTPAYTAPVNSELVTAFKEAIRKVKYMDAKLVRKTGSGDMNIFGKMVKVPTITYGPGNSRLSHTPYEKVEIKEYLDSIEVVKKAAISLCNRK